MERHERRHSRRALALNGDGNFGAHQAGAQQPVVDAGFRQDLIVGTSAGALRGLLFASDPTRAACSASRLPGGSSACEGFGIPGLLGSARRLVTNRHSLVPNILLARYVARSLGWELTTFGELEALHGVRVRTIAVCRETGERIAFGDRDDNRLIDGAMSSTALPLYPAPWRAAGRCYSTAACSPSFHCCPPSSAAPCRSWPSMSPM